MKNDQASMPLKMVRFKVIEMSLDDESVAAHRRRIGQFADLLLAILCCRFEIEA
jgi:hypothetical protein